MKLQDTKGCKAVSHNGEIYEVAADGTVDVPAHAVAPLSAHGFIMFVPRKVAPVQPLKPAK